MNKTVLITGGSGLIGQPLTKSLSEAGYVVHHLSRKDKASSNGAKIFKWDIQAKEIDPDCIQGVGAIVHLAGEGIADKPWRNSQKDMLIESRTESIRLLYDLLRQTPGHEVKAVISASGIGIYGDRGDELLTEGSTAGNDFMSHICVSWEKAVDEGLDLGLRTVKLRTGVVVTSEGGALSKMTQPIRAGIGSPLGSGKQWIPWIHIDDIIKLYKYALENEMISGAYNAASPIPVTNKDFTRALARQLDKPLWLPAVPAFALRILLGEMSAVVLNSTRTSSNKIKEAGFNFTFEKIEDALENIYAK